MTDDDKCTQPGSPCPMCDDTGYEIALVPIPPDAFCTLCARGLAVAKESLTAEAIARHLDAEEERREQALAEMLDDGHPGDEPGLGNSWDWAGGD